MTNELFVPDFKLDSSSTKDKIISILSNESQLKTKKIHFLLKKQYGLGVTYQAVHKLIKQLVKQGVLKEENHSYSINEEWIKELRVFIDKLLVKERDESPKPVQISKTTIQYDVKTIHEMEKIYLQERENFFKEVKRFDEKDRIICVHAPHLYFSLMSPSTEYNHMERLVKTKTTQYALVRGDTLVDKWIQTFYHAKKEQPFKVKIGATCSSINERCIYPDKMIELFYTDKFWNFYNNLYEEVQNYQDINITKIMEKLYKLKDEPIKIMIHKDPEIVSLARDETLTQFKELDMQDKKYYKINISPETFLNRKLISFIFNNDADLWDMCIPFLWDYSYIVGLNEFLKSKNIKTILDAACGTGFPSIELKKIGWDITCSDGSEIMLRRFAKNLEKENLTLPYHHVNWLDLDKKLDKKFDVVFIRGNSLIYVDSWDNNNISKNTLEHIKKTLKNIYQLLNSGGFFYVDITHEKEFDRDKYPIIEDFGDKIFNGMTLKSVWELTHDYKKKIRTWKSIFILGKDNEKVEVSHYSYLLRHKELIKLLKEAGFKKVEKTNIKGENNYAVFVAYK
ncbi:methyltransferase domain-containing protein [Candidatus Woesearchaeota archaeon]|nr:methyltransferase domain-containing protein [Candidatus Woesearchaeota archaeon]